MEKRLIKILNEEIKQLQENIENSDDIKEINTIVNHLVNELKSSFKIPENKEKNQEDKPIVVEEKLLIQEKMRFFKPKNLETQKKAAEIDKALDIVRPT